MSLPNKLKQFQRHTVDFVLEKLKSRSTYAIADEVGLGKTWTVAEVALQLVRQKTRERHQTIFYISPSFELIDQNLKMIEAHIASQCDPEAYVVKRLTSRLSRVEHDIARELGSGNNKRHIFIVGLSPETSFQVKGKGSIAERQVLAALLSFRKGASYRNKVESYFWNLEPRVRQSFRNRIHALRKLDLLPDYLYYQNDPKIKRTMEEILAYPDPRLSAPSRKAVRWKLGDLRKALVNRWMSRKRICTLLILDEWHKYKKTCFSEGLLSQFISKIRTHESAKLLLVSATPFAVHFDDSESGGRKRHLEDDFKSLFELYYGKQESIAKYDAFRELQDTYLSSIEEFVRADTPSRREESELAASSAKMAYELALLEICVRTERPSTHDTAKEVHLGAPPNWNDTKDSLPQFLRSFAQIDTGTPVSQMWLDGHEFVEFKEYKIAERNLKNLKGDHWKLKRLHERIRQEYKGDRLHSILYPPLWCSSQVGAEKHLIFTEFGFLPHEIAAGLQYGEVSITSAFKGSVLGYFPIQLKSAERRSEIEREVQKNIYWIHFYPWLAFENQPSASLTEKQLETILNDSFHLVDAVLRIERHFCGNDAGKHMRLDHRVNWLSGGQSPEIRRGATKYLRDIFVTRRTRQQIPGAILARCAATLGLITDEHNQALRHQEGALLEVANALLKMFASPEAQKLANRHSRTVNRRSQENKYLRFAIWYCARFDLEGTLKQYFYLLSGNNSNAGDIFAVAASAMGLKRATNGSRCARPFNDKKEVDGDEDGEKLSPKSLRNGFNSPFPPYVLVSTSIGQEGLDFHLYCDRVIHWSPPPSPSVLQQREGRVDRFRSLQNRKAQATLRKVESTLGQLPPDTLELSPDFVVLHPTGRRLNATQRFVMYLPYSAQEARWRKCVQRMYYNNLLIGVPDPLSVERRFQALLGGSQEERQVKLEQFNGHCVSLRPR